MIITGNVLKEDISKIFINRLFESNPVDEVSHDVTFIFYDQTETGIVVTLSNFSIRLYILFYV